MFKGADPMRATTASVNPLYTTSHGRWTTYMEWEMGCGVVGVLLIIDQKMF